MSSERAEKFTRECMNDSVGRDLANHVTTQAIEAMTRGFDLCEKPQQQMMIATQLMIMTIEAHYAACSHACGKAIDPESYAKEIAKQMAVAVARWQVEVAKSIAEKLAADSGGWSF